MTTPSPKPYTEVVRITAVDAETGQGAGPDGMGIVAWGTSGAEEILRCASTLDQLRAIVGDLGDPYARYELAWFVAPHLGPPWETRVSRSEDERQVTALRELDARFAPHRELLAAHYLEDCGGTQSSACVVRIVHVDPCTGDSGGASYGVWARGRFGPAISRWAASLPELAQQVGNLSDERALWEAVQHVCPAIGTWDGHPVDVLDAWFAGANPGDARSMDQPTARRTRNPTRGATPPPRADRRRGS